MANTAAGTDLAKVEAFINSPQYVEFVKAFRRLNVFGSTGMGTQEVKHSFFLSNLMDPKSGECTAAGIGDKFIRYFLGEVFKNAQLPPGFNGIYGDLAVKREHVFGSNNKRVDIVLYSEAEKIVILIENKVLASERVVDYSDPQNKTNGEKGQLKDYVDGLKADPLFSGDYQKPGHALYIFLTPDGREPSEKNSGKWLPASYSVIRDGLESIVSGITGTFDPYKPVPDWIKVKSWIEDYIDLIRSKINMDEQSKARIRELFKDPDFMAVINAAGDIKREAKYYVAKAIAKALRKHGDAIGIDLDSIKEPDSISSSRVIFKTKKLGSIVGADIAYFISYAPNGDDGDIMKGKFVCWCDLLNKNDFSDEKLIELKQLFDPKFKAEKFKRPKNENTLRLVGQHDAELKMCGQALDDAYNVQDSVIEKYVKDMVIAKISKIESNI